MLEALFQLYDELVEKENTIHLVLGTLGGDPNHGFLMEQLEQMEKIIVFNMGGNEDHYVHIDSSMVFHEYQEGHLEREEVIGYIQDAIKNDWKEEVTATLIRG